MREHRHQHMVMPARVLAPFIVVHPELRFAFCKALLDGESTVGHNQTKVRKGVLAGALLM